MKIPATAEVLEKKVEEVEDEAISESHSNYSNLVESFFMAELLNKRQMYELKVSSLKSESEDGSILYFFKPKSIDFTFSFGTKVTFTIMDKNGNVKAIP